MEFIWWGILASSFLWTALFHIYEPIGLRALFFFAIAFGCTFLSNYKKRKFSFLPFKNTVVELIAIFSAQGIVLSIYKLWAARVHKEALFGKAASFLLNIAGLNNVYENYNIYVDSYRHTAAFLSNPEKAGYLYLLLIFAGGVAVLMLGKASFKKIAALGGILCVYNVFRYALLIAMMYSYYIHSMFWEWSMSFISFIPLAFILGTFIKTDRVEYAHLFEIKERKTAFISATLVFLLVVSGVSFFLLHDYGVEKQGRVLVDEYHSDWEWTTEAYDTSWFGERSGYNYYCFYDYIDKFYETDRNLGPITKEALAQTDIFIMKTPTLPFENSEIEAILEFVEVGGGLYLIGDHTNVFGTSTNLNPLAKHFGMYFNHDSTYELVQGSLSEYDAPKFTAHPAITGLPHFLFATSCTMDISWQCEEIITGYGLKTFPVDYSQRNFFPEQTNGGDIEFGLFIQSAGAYYGKGRVVAFTDSTVFSNFWMYMNGKPQLLLSTLSWLNRENTFARLFSPKAISLSVFAILLAANIGFCIWKRKKLTAAYNFAGGVAGIVFAVIFFGVLNSLNAKPAEPVKPMVNICFDREYSNYNLPDSLEGFLSDMDKQLSTFYVWTQRLGYYPETSEKLEKALGGDLAVIIKPEKDIKNIDKIIEKLEAGGKLLILDNAESGGHSNGLLNKLGMEIVEKSGGKYAVYGEIKDIPLTSKAAAITGGQAIITDNDNNAIMSISKVGEGMIIVFSDPDLMFNMEMGDVSANLNEKTEKLSQVEFKMIREIIENKQE